jgi:hypothetical protein
MVVIEGQPVAIVRSWFGRGMTKLRFVCPDCNGGCYVLHIIKGKPVCRRCGELDYSQGVASWLPPGATVAR